MNALPDDLAHDRHRPRYHFLPHANWMNDPNGLIHWQGYYHLFYQYNPHGPFHGTIHWGHARSADLCHWEHLPVALAPAPGDWDADGCWSGCAVNADGVPLLFYTGTSPQRQLLATGSPDLLHWQKHPEPLIATPPPDIDAGPHQDFRDPYIWRGDDGWYMVIGSQDVGKGGVILLYCSDDLLNWKYLHPLLRTSDVQNFPIWSGSMWECPNFFPLDESHVLMLSVWDQQVTYYPVAFTGDYAGQCFTPRRQSRVDWGGCFYAPQVLRDADNRALMWGWLWEQRARDAQLAAGWAGVMSLPRVLSLAPDGGLLQKPAPELAQLRLPAACAGVALDLTGASDALSAVHGEQLELWVEFDPLSAAEVGLDVCVAPDAVHGEHAEEFTRIAYDATRGVFYVDTTHASLSATAFHEIVTAPFTPQPGASVQLRVFVDHSVVEVFVDERVCFAVRSYPTHPDSLGLRPFARGGQPRFERLEVWELQEAI
ncbi:MAG: Sucrose-6-phosphate hydrolase [Chloroflexi bacterium ADurb.Bin360]|nr:MAG: Sucrose-6-phosphate hydrolase [Chloroflexi bacterium ADurb.Bin360]